MIYWEFDRYVLGQRTKGYFSMKSYDKMILNTQKNMNENKSCG